MKGSIIHAGRTFLHFESVSHFSGFKQSGVELLDVCVSPGGKTINPV